MKQRNASRPLPPDVREEFLAHVTVTLGLIFPDGTDFVVSDEISRATPNNDKNVGKFWYRIFESPTWSAVYGHWPSGDETQRWNSDLRGNLTDAQAEEIRQQAKQVRRQRAAELQRLSFERRQEVAAEWEQGKPITDAFGYFKKKGIAGPLPDELRLVKHSFPRPHNNPFTGTVSERRKDDEDALMVPLHKLGSSEIAGAEYIAADGKKDYAYGLSPSGLVYTFGTHANGQPVYICEGIATAWDVARLSGSVALRAGSCGNLKAVKKAACAHYGSAAPIIVCAERGNGFAQGVEAAATLGGVYCTPPFADDDEGSDFNDYRLLYGDEATREALQIFVQPIDAPAVGSQDAATRAFIEEINEDYFVGINWGSGTRIGRTNPDGTHYSILETDLKLALANRRSPGLSNKKAHAYWLDHASRRQYENVAYAPPGTGRIPPLDPVHDLNLWTGFAVKPNPDGKWDLMKRHMLDNICSGEKRVYEYLIRLIAYQVQYPGRACGVATMLRGVQGCGKSTLLDALLHLFGPHGLSINRTDQLIGSFSGHLEHKSLIVGNEVGWANDHEFNDSIKSLITDARIPIHPKGRALYHVPNTLNFWFTTNREHAVKIGGDNRRMFVLEVRDPWANLFGDSKDNARRKYFSPLRKQYYEEGGDGAMLHECLNLDLTGFNPGAFPRTRAAAEQVEMSMSSVDRYLLQLFRDGDWQPGQPWKDGQRVDKALLYAAYLRYAESQRDRYPAINVVFWKRWREVTGDSAKEYRPRNDKAGERRKEIALPCLKDVRMRAAVVLGVSV